MGYQFIHIEMYSRTGRQGRGVDWVLNEAARISDSCLHVVSPTAPQVAFGDDVETVRAKHAIAATTATTTTRTGHTRAIRRDQNTLLTVVASHPALLSDTQPETLQAVLEWETLTIAWLRQQFGDAVVSVVRHTDETHPHIHAFILPTDTEMRASALHPGAKAKADILSNALPGEDRKLANKRGDLAYRKAMRSWQDSFWQAVGKPCGLARLGPGRRRLSRAEWRAEQTVQASANVAHKEAGAIDAQIKGRLQVADEAQKAAQRELSKVIADTSHTVARAHAEAAAVVSKGMAEAAALQSKMRSLTRFVSRLRAVWDGLRISTIRNQVQEQYESQNTERIEALKAARERAEHAVREERRHRNETEAKLGRLQLIVQEICLERDRLRSTVNRLRGARREPTAMVRPKP